MKSMLYVAQTTEVQFAYQQTNGQQKTAKWTMIRFIMIFMNSLVCIKDFFKEMSDKIAEKQ